MAGQRIGKVTGHRGEGESKEGEEAMRQHLALDALVAEECRSILPCFG